MSDTLIAVGTTGSGFTLLGLILYAYLNHTSLHEAFVWAVKQLLGTVQAILGG